MFLIFSEQMSLNGTMQWYLQDVRLAVTADGVPGQVQAKTLADVPQQLYALQRLVTKLRWNAHYAFRVAASIFRQVSVWKNSFLGIFRVLGFSVLHGVGERGGHVQDGQGKVLVGVLGEGVEGGAGVWGEGVPGGGGEGAEGVVGHERRDVRAYETCGGT